MVGNTNKPLASRMFIRFVETFSISKIEILLRKLKVSCSIAKQRQYKVSKVNQLLNYVYNQLVLSTNKLNYGNLVFKKRGERIMIYIKAIYLRVFIVS